MIAHWIFEPHEEKHISSNGSKVKYAVNNGEQGKSVLLRTGTCYIRDIFVLLLQDYCAPKELLMKMNFIIAVAPPFVIPMTSLPAMPTHSVQKYGFFSEPTRWRQVAKYGNLKHCESLSFTGEIEGLKPSKF